MTKVIVVGGAGHVGLPFSIHMANSGVDVTILDTNFELMKYINDGNYPYSENRGEELLRQALGSGNLKFESYWPDVPLDVDFVHIMIGTPMDEYGVGSIKPLFGLAELIHEKWVNVDKTPVIVLRSTVSLGTTELLAKKLYRFDVYFCPERVAEGKTFEEITSIPQIIGWPLVYRTDTYHDLIDHFTSIGVHSIVTLSHTEAELAKLITNMYRYVNFAFANEVALLTEKFDIDLNKTINAANLNYPRMNMPKPGPALGPCLGKDFSFLLDGDPINGVIAAADKINNHMPEFYVSQLECWLTGDPIGKEILVMGASFKANSNDTRLSLTPKVVSILENKGYTVEVWDPIAFEDHDYVPDFGSYDGIIIMVNHDAFKDDYITQRIVDSDVPIIDPWRILE